MTSPGPSQYRHIADLIDAGRAEEARALLQRIIAKTPNERNACVLMRHTLRRLGEHQQALYFAEKALKHDPRDPDLLCLVAGSQFDLGQADAAERGFRTAVELRSTHFPALLGLANVVGLRGDFVESAALARRALELNPNDRSAMGLFCSSLIHLGRADDAVTTLKHAMLRDPTSIWLLSLLCNALNYAAESTPEDTLAAHKLFGRLVSKQVALGPFAKRPAAPTTADADRPLRLGILSADLRDHPVACYVEPILEHFDRDRLHIHIYHNSGMEDQVSARLKAYRAVRWTNVAPLAPAQIAQRLRDDHIDIALDLSGHTAGNSLLALHFRPAPVSLTWLGYASTTGLESMDYRLVDSTTDPASPAQFDALSTEKLWRLDPCFFAYRPPLSAADLPQPGPVPEASQGKITFGSFSSMPKMNQRVINVWAKVLQSVPNSVLLMRSKGLSREESRQHLRQRFKDAGIAPDRLLIEGPTPNAAATLREYARIDIALDTFPFQGMTTLCEASLMGVPAVLMAGHTSAGRQGIPIANAVGLSDLVASSDDQYVDIAKALAADRPGRERLRDSLRPTFLASTVCDQVGFTRRFETALRQMFRAAAK